MEEQVYAFIEYIADERRYTPNTYLAYRNDLLQLLQFILGERPQASSWARVDGLLLQAFLLQLKARGYSPSTVARKTAAIRSFYYYLSEEHLIGGNPARSLEVPPLRKRLAASLTEDQIDALLGSASDRTATGVRDRAILEILYATGLRVSELVALDLTAFDVQGGVLTVDSSNRPRTFKLQPRVVDALRTYLESGRPALKTRAEAGPLFVNTRGQQLTRQGIWLILKRYFAQAGIESQATPHSLRHAFAAHRLKQGERVQELQRLLGHAHLSTTMLYNRESKPSS